MGVTSLTITPSDSLAKCLLPIPMTLYFAGLEILTPKRAMLPPGGIGMIPLNWKLRPIQSPAVHMLLNQQAKKTVTVLAGIIDSDYQRETVPLLHRRSLRAFLNVTMPCGESQWKIQTSC